MTRTLSTVLLATMLAGGAQADTIALVGGTIIDGAGGEVDNGVLVVNDGRIACVGTAADCAVPGNASVHDVTGSFITPGLVDAHVHFAQTGWLDGRPDGSPDPSAYPYKEVTAQLRAQPERWHNSYLCSGVTAVFDVGGQPWTVTDGHATDTDRSDRVHVRAAGPLVTHAGRNEVFSAGEDQPLFLPMDSAEQIRADAARVAAMGSAALKVWYLQPSDDRREELDALLMVAGEAAAENGLPLIVHATDLREAKAALRAGAKMLVHSVDNEAVDAEFIELLLANEAVYAPTIVVSDRWIRAVSSVAHDFELDIDDPNRCVDAAMMERIGERARLREAMRGNPNFNGERYFDLMKNIGRAEAIMEANLRAVHAAGGHVVLATDAGNPLTLHGPSINWEIEAMQRAGIPASELIGIATLAGARALGLDAQTGSLEAGKIADLLVLAEDPREDVRAFRSLTHVMRAGDLKTQEELQVR